MSYTTGVHGNKNDMTPYLTLSNDDHHNLFIPILKKHNYELVHHRMGDDKSFYFAKYNRGKHFVEITNADAVGNWSEGHGHVSNFDRGITPEDLDDHLSIVHFEKSKNESNMTSTDDLIISKLTGVQESTPINHNKLNIEMLHQVPQGRAHRYHGDAEHVVAEVLNGGFSQLADHTMDNDEHHGPTMLNRTAKYFADHGHSDVGEIFKKAVPHVERYQIPDHNRYSDHYNHDNDDYDAPHMKAMDKLDGEFYDHWNKKNLKSLFPGAY